MRASGATGPGLRADGGPQQSAAAETPKARPPLGHPVPVQMMAESQRPPSQRELDKITFDLYVDCRCSVAETVHQSGLAASTVRARVRRHSLRLRPGELAMTRVTELADDG